MDNRPIGFLDSGVGGLTVVRELMRQLPHEEIVYIGDSARAPYGQLSFDQGCQNDCHCLQYCNSSCLGRSQG